MASREWTFARIGGFDQVQIESGEDLVSLGELDQKLWVALACPSAGIEFDARTLALVDTDKDGRVRATELIAAVEWADKMLKDPATLETGDDSLALNAVDGSHAEGKLWLQTARAVLESLDKSSAKSVSVADAEAGQTVFAKRAFNGDGVVTAAAATDESTKKVVEDLLACTTPASDRGGSPGFTEALAKTFFDDIAAHAAWLAEGDDAKVRPIGEKTPAAYDALVAVRAKIDDYFTRCRVAAFDPRALAGVNREESAYVALGTKSLDAGAPELREFPLSQAAAEKPLALDRGVNPAYGAHIATFRKSFLEPLGVAKTTLSDVEWTELRGRLDAYEAWVAAKKGAAVEKLGAARVKELSTSDARTKIDALLAQEKEAEPLAASIEAVERLVRYNRDLFALANNFVSFKDFYSRKSPATFQVGTLFLDTRSCELCIRVADAGRHATMAPLANTYLVYCDCKNSKGETMAIAAAMTAGDVDGLMVGRNGVFYDRKGKDWDATITKIIDNPISIRQAFWSPYKKVLRLVEEQVARRAATAAAESDARMQAQATAATATATSGATTAPAAAPAAAATPAATPARRFDIGVVAALGVAVGGIATAFGAFLAALFGLGIWMPLGFVGLMLAISGPSMAIAWLKLRKRTLGPLLDANGWAVNAQARVNVPLGTSLTKLAKLPDGARRTIADPFAEKTRPWGVYIFLIVLLGLAGAWFIGRLDSYLPAAVRSTRVLGRYAPAAPAAGTPAAAATPNPPSPSSP